MHQQSIESAAVDDLDAIVRIDNYTAAHSTANFASRPTSVSERLAWFEQHSATGKYPLLVARKDGTVIGYAASNRYRDHEALEATVEVSVALDADCRGQGIGAALYEELFALLGVQPVHVALAGIALPNDASVALHRRFGFTDVGTFRDYARKNDQYISSLWMQRVFTSRQRD
jgi:phosphinothricin acetyltransferase